MNEEELKGELDAVTQRLDFIVICLKAQADWVDALQIALVEMRNTMNGTAYKYVRPEQL